MKTALIIEDQPSNIQIFCLLTHQGYRVLEATTGKEAIEAANPEIGPIDLILCDLTLLIPLVQSSLGSLSSRSKCGGPHRLWNTQTGWSESERKDLTSYGGNGLIFSKSPSPHGPCKRKSTI